MDLVEKNRNKFITMDLAIDGEVIGSCTIRLFAEDAPNTVENFITLAEQGFYDGLLFHRLIPGFMIQGGDPDGTGTGGPGYQIPAEFNDRRHVTGTVAMARSSTDPDSAGSQFYICLAPAQHLNRNYTVFGQVSKGMANVLALAEVGADENNIPLQHLSMENVRVVEGAPV